MAFSSGLGRYGDRLNIKYYEDAVKNFQRYGGQAGGYLNVLEPNLRTWLNYYKPGGGYGVGQKMRATKNIQRGVAADTIAAVSAGMSSLPFARGLKSRAASELTTQFRDIEDTGAQLGMQAGSLYDQMISNLSWLATGYPRYAPSYPPQRASGGGGIVGGRDPSGILRPFGPAPNPAAPSHTGGYGSGVSHQVSPGPVIDVSAALAQQGYYGDLYTDYGGWGGSDYYWGD